MEEIGKPNVDLVIPAFIADRIVKALAKFEITQCTEFVNEMCRYWVLKKEHLKGAYLLKRLQKLCAFREFPFNKRARSNH